MRDIPVRKINASSKELNSSQSFNIRDVRDLLAGRDMIQELHRHDFFYILALKKGKGKHEIDFVSYKMENYSVFIMRPGQVHALTLKAGSIGYLMEFKMDFYNNEKELSQLLRTASQINHYLFDADGFKKIFTLLTTAFHEYIDKKEKYREVIKAKLNILFIELGRWSNNASSDKSGLYTQQRLEDLLQLLEVHVAVHKQVSYYADRLHLSSYQLNAVTQTTLGKTVSEVINEHIILESKRYLLATANQVIQIAYYLGYEDVSYFIRFFRKHTGYTPEAFRRHFQLSAM